MKMHTLAAILATIFTLGAAGSSAASVVLDFSGVGEGAAVQDYYNGGTDSQGNSGPNYGINFSGNSLGIHAYNGCCSPDPGIVYYLSGGAATMNVAAGFDTGFSFYYSSSNNAFINVYDGLNGTGTVLATLSLANQYSNGCNNGYCNWTPIGVTFAGTAHSVDFGGGDNNVGYDDITLGSAKAGGGAVPEPATWALMISGFGLAGVALRRRRSVATFA